jgi:hypothetical protein
VEHYGFEANHKDLQRFALKDSPDYQRIVADLRHLIKDIMDPTSSIGTSVSNLPFALGELTTGVSCGA